MHRSGELSAVSDGARRVQRRRQRWLRWQRWLDRVSDRLNPILVKEARQAMKSRQFVITFALLLICAWGWSLLGVALLSPGVYYAPGGRFMLTGYYFILAFPLLVVVPYSAFRSLASEREDGTYELLSISTLSPHQIVSGKLGSAILQMVVYLSALSPCVAFTYLLRGVDIVLLASVLAIVSLASLLLSAVGLLLGTLTKAKHWQVVLSVAMIVGLVAVFLYVTLSVTIIVIGESGLPLDQAAFWSGVAASLTFYCSLLAIVLLAASARLAPASDNRSTRLRIAMLAQYLLLAGWFIGFAIGIREVGVLIPFILLAAIHWYVMGALMTGESEQISPRVKRSLPRSLLGRVFLIWFFPGPGKGYFFAVTGMFSAVILVGLCQVQPIWDWILPGPTGGAGLTSSGMSAGYRMFLLTLSCVLMCYVVIYLGVGRLIVMRLSRWCPTGVIVALAVNLLLLALGALGPLIVQLSLRGVISDAGDYTPLQWTNVFWTVYETERGAFWSATVPIGSVACPIVPLLLVVTAVVVLALNLVRVVPEIMAPRVAVPDRVWQDELQLHPEKAPPPPGPTNPWDDGHAGSSDGGS